MGVTFLNDRWKLAHEKSLPFSRYWVTKTVVYKHYQQKWWNILTRYHAIWFAISYDISNVYLFSRQMWRSLYLLSLFQALLSNAMPTRVATPPGHHQACLFQIQPVLHHGKLPALEWLECQWILIVALLQGICGVKYDVYSRLEPRPFLRLSICFRSSHDQTSSPFPSPFSLRTQRAATQIRHSRHKNILKQSTIPNTYYLLRNLPQTTLVDRTVTFWAVGLFWGVLFLRNGLF